MRYKLTSEGIAGLIERRILEGDLGSGELLPTVRAHAAELDVAPATVAAAYKILQIRGVAVSDGRRGTRVRQRPALLSRLPPQSTENVREAANHLVDLSSGNPDPELLPDLAQALRKVDSRPRLYDEPLVNRELETVARKQLAADAIDASHLTIVGGALDGIERVLREHLRIGDRVVVEDPCFAGILDLIGMLGLTAVPAAVDDEGFLPEELDHQIRTAAAVIVTPRAQNPTGARLTEARARKLRKILATRRSTLLIEDDHAGPIAGCEYVSLVSPRVERWVVVRSVSKFFGPDLRLAVVAGDRLTIGRVEGRQTLGSRWVSHLLQETVAELWKSASVMRLVDRAARSYDERRSMLIRLLAQQGIAARGESGLNVWIEVDNEPQTVTAIAQRGWSVLPGERCRIKAPQAIRVTVARATKSILQDFSSDLATILGGRSTLRAV